MTPVVFDYAQVAPKVEEALRQAFPSNTTREGYLGRVQVILVSPSLNGLAEREKQERVWEVLRAHLGEDAQAVSFVIAYGTDEL